MALSGDAKLWRGIVCTLVGGIGWGFPVPVDNICSLFRMSVQIG